jgi:hypothetical protein
MPSLPRVQTLAEMWELYERLVLAKATPAERQIACDAFYNGAGTLVSKLLSIGPDRRTFTIPESLRTEVLEAWDAEIVDTGVRRLTS